MSYSNPKANCNPKNVKDIRIGMAKGDRKKALLGLRLSMGQVKTKSGKKD